MDYTLQCAGMKYTKYPIIRRYKIVIRTSREK